MKKEIRKETEAESIPIREIQGKSPLQGHIKVLGGFYDSVPKQFLKI